ncbi:hypothetical protein [Acinetobacter baumannii]|uniref:Uncharacterized protein n=1 Tax=Acinetobacter baumannii TaxID=470 RepID=A0A6L8MAM6_ACIBA|nr:hypothetical protein [Acinetobacter baumannii]EJB8498062.1 hypothetical protein [Acinetobacter baumannii]KCY22163.1 hypothetical protein J635_2256 [Acinetobacter baumannii 233846]MYM79022.1 hypothetical protein [Acinetobacter baumannii]
MDKCREQFEKQRYWIGLFRDAVDFDEELGRYVLNGQRKLYAFHLDSFNEKWAIWQEAWQHHQAKVEELQALYTQQGINMLKMQKRVDAAQKLIDDWNCGGVHIFDLLDELEQALKGEG